MTSDKSYLRVDYRAVYKAWLAFRKGKKPTGSIDRFAFGLENYLAHLSDELTNKSYAHGGYKEISLTEKKRRDLAVASVRDRVVHRLLYDHLLVKFDTGFDPDVWSCRTGKGLHKCLDRTQKLLRKYDASYVWRADITKFFDTVDQKVLVGCLTRRIGHDETAMWLCQEAIDSYNVQPARGIPIGNLTSQLFANIYLNEFDRYVRHTLKPQAYVRYGDDFLLFYPTRRQTRQARETAAKFLKNNLGLKLNPKNDIVIAARSGLKFLGHMITGENLAVDDYTTRRVLKRIDRHNASSYRALPLLKEARDGIDWVLVEKLDILLYN
ncbi:MAG TPA: reverse transcriptase/maturase family protein [Candidatus Dormibacteraeota bacterium]|nr:reverse transcriptase/maturase family protein [Candidatus Dormibacteraeota bacterium]